MVGNKSNFKEEDVIRAFLLIDKKLVSRIELVKKLSLGEGTIRTILGILKEKGLLESNNQGHLLSKKGLKRKKDLLNDFEMPKKLTLNSTYKRLKSCGILIRNPGKVKIGFELRDEAIRSGSYSAIIFRYDEDLKIPESEINFKEEYKEDYEELKNSFNFEKNSILIVTFDRDYRTCENSALVVARKIKEINI